MRILVRLKFYDPSVRKTGTVFLERRNPNLQSWCGKVGSERFGPWVKEAPGMYLVTVSDDPEVGIVTRPLDSVRSVYPELFQE